MKGIVESDAAAALAFCRQRFGLARCTENQKGIVLRQGGVVVAATVYDDFNGSNVWMHCAGAPGRRWLNREFLYWAFHYPFEQLGVRRITLWVEADNQDSRRFAEHLGFRLEATLTGAGMAGGDVLLYVMFNKDCRHVEALRDYVEKER